MDLVKTPDRSLKIVLNDNGSEQFKDIEFERDQSGIVAALHMLLEDHLANGCVPKLELGNELGETGPQ